jgi:plastocyanin
MLLLNIFSWILIIGFTSYVILFTHRYKDRFTCMAGMMIAMTTGMMSSLLVGSILGSLTQGQLVHPTILAVLVGMGVGYCTGIPISLMAALDGLLAGIMGGMMGAMLGVMVFSQSSSIMIGFVDVIFVVVMFLLIKLMKEEAGINSFKTDRNERLFSRKWYIFPIILILFVILAKAGGIQALFGSTPDSSVNPLDISEQKKSYQEAVIIVGQNGYIPEEVKVKAGVPVKLRFQKGYPGGCLSYLIIKDFDIQKLLKQGETTVEFTPKQPGSYSYTCGMGMYRGTILVEP